MNLKKDHDLLKTSLSNDGIFRIILNNPDAHNLLSEEMIKKIQYTLIAISTHSIKSNLPSIYDSPFLHSLCFCSY